MREIRPESMANPCHWRAALMLSALAFFPGAGVAQWTVSAPIHQGDESSSDLWAVVGGLDYDDQGVPWIAYPDYDASPSQLTIRRGVWDSVAGWTFPTVEYSEPGGYGVDLATCGGEVAIVNRDPGGGVRAILYSGGQWTGRDLGFYSGMGGYQSVAWIPGDCNAGPAFAFHAQSGNGRKNKTLQLRFQFWDGQSVVLDESKKAFSYDKTLAFDANGSPAIAYSYDDGVKLAFSSAADFSNPQFETVFPRPGDLEYQAAYRFDLVFDGAGHPIVSFADGQPQDHTLKVCRRDLPLASPSGTWTCEQIASPSLLRPGYTYYSHLAFDSRGQLLSGFQDYRDAAGIGVRIARRCSPTSWSEGELWALGEAVGDGLGDSQIPMSLAVDPMIDAPAVLFWEKSYTTSPRYTLRFAWRGSGSVQLQETGVLCADGVDNDCDAAIDSADPDCVGDPCFGPPFPFEGQCDDGDNNDCDTLIDCEDSDCYTDPACVGPICDPKGAACVLDEDCCSGVCKRNGVCR